MKLFKEIGLLVILGLGAFGLFIWGVSLTVNQKTVPAWSPNGEPLSNMDHHNALICGLRMAEASPVQNRTQVLVHFIGGGGGGQQLRLFPSSRGLCGELVMDHFSNTPVQVMLNPDDSANFSGFTATYWEPTRLAEPAPAYAWVTVSLTEREERWWIQFVFQSVSLPVTTVTVGVD